MAVRLRSTIGLFAPKTAAPQEPGVWDRLKKLFGKNGVEDGAVDATLTTAALVQAVKTVLARLGVTNAVALAIDGQVLFEDRTGRPDDVDELFAAFHESEAAKARSLANVRLAVEQREAGVHLVIEIDARGTHDEAAAIARVIVSGRVAELTPRAGEDAKAYRLRVGPSLATSSVVESARLELESFVARVAEALRAALPEVRVSEDEPQALVDKPARARSGAARAARRPETLDPFDARYDPYDRYFPSAAPELAARTFWSAMLAWSPLPLYVVIDAEGNEIGTTDDLVDESAAGQDVDLDCDVCEDWEPPADDGSW